MIKKIQINPTTCQVCGHQTDWDSSYGRENFIVCPKCYKGITERVSENFQTNDKFFDSLKMIFILADVRKENL